MIKQLTINGLKSYDDFGVYIATRKISSPKKKSIKESIPFSNVVYDFSNINGEIYWEERTLEYSFDIAEFTTEEMETVKSKLLDWLLNVHDADIYDPYIGDYHYHGSFDSDSWEEDFGAGTIDVSFTVYPYKIANSSTRNTYTLSSGANSIIVENESSHRLTPVITCSESVIIQIGSNSYSISKGSTTNDLIRLQKGQNEFVVTATTDGATIIFEYVKEVF